MRAFVGCLQQQPEDFSRADQLAACTSQRDMSAPSRVFDEALTRPARDVPGLRELLATPTVLG